MATRFNNRDLACADVLVHGCCSLVSLGFYCSLIIEYGVNTITMAKSFKGEKYIYLLMAYTLAKQNNGVAIIGYDNGTIGGQNYYRKFNITQYRGETLLTETKTSKHFADFSRTFRVVSYENDRKPVITEYLNENGENVSKVWTH